MKHRGIWVSTASIILLGAVCQFAFQCGRQPGFSETLPEKVPASSQVYLSLRDYPALEPYFPVGNLAAQLMTLVVKVIAKTQPADVPTGQLDLMLRPLRDHLDLPRPLVEKECALALLGKEDNFQPFLVGSWTKENAKAFKESFRQAVLDVTVRDGSQLKSSEEKLDGTTITAWSFEGKSPFGYLAEKGETYWVAGSREVIEKLLKVTPGQSLARNPQFLKILRERPKNANATLFMNLTDLGKDVETSFQEAMAKEPKLQAAKDIVAILKRWTQIPDGLGAWMTLEGSTLIGGSRLFLPKNGENAPMLDFTTKGPATVPVAYRFASPGMISFGSGTFQEPSVLYKELDQLLNACVDYLKKADLKPDSEEMAIAALVQQKFKEFKPLVESLGQEAGSVSFPLPDGGGSASMTLIALSDSKKAHEEITKWTEQIQELVNQSAPKEAALFLPRWSTKSVEGFEALSLSFPLPVPFAPTLVFYKDLLLFGSNEKALQTAIQLAEKGDGWKRLQRSPEFAAYEDFFPGKCQGVNYANLEAVLKDMRSQLTQLSNVTQMLGAFGALAEAPEAQQFLKLLDPEIIRQVGELLDAFSRMQSYGSWHRSLEGEVSTTFKMVMEAPKGEKV